jgi:exodeoxyribonuclease (lambda-induced)
MARGVELELDAFDFINFSLDYEFETCGFVDSGIGIGCSPDGIDMENETGLEIKCPLPHTHLSYLISGKVPLKYIPQIQGSMMVTGFKQWVFCSYHPDMTPLILIEKRDDVYIDKLQKILEKFYPQVDEIYKKYRTLNEIS